MPSSLKLEPEVELEPRQSHVQRMRRSLLHGSCHTFFLGPGDRSALKSNGSSPHHCDCCGFEYEGGWPLCRGINLPKRFSGSCYIHLLYCLLHVEVHELLVLCRTGPSDSTSVNQF